MTIAAPAPAPRTALRLGWQVPSALALAVLAVAVSGSTPLALAGAALAAVAPELARIDAREHRLPNRMTLPALAVAAVAVLASALAGGPWLAPAVAGVAAGTGMTVLSLLGGVGMGDAKLAALIGLASPTALVAVAAPLLGLLAGGVAGTVVLLRVGPRHRVPLGPFLLLGWVGALVVVLATGGSST